MPETRKSTYRGYTAAQKRATEKYHQKFHEVKIRMTPEHHEMVKKYAEAHDLSTSAFINLAINEKIERDG